MFPRCFSLNRRCDTIGSIIVEIGEKAGVKVAERTSKRGQKIKYASAHDLRRASGKRWASRVMPLVLQQLMRHENIQTTLTFYVDQDAEATADDVWHAFANDLANSVTSEQKATSESNL